MRCRNAIVSRRASGDERGVDAGVECGEAAAMLDRKTKKVDVRELLGSWERREKAGIREGKSSGQNWWPGAASKRSRTRHATDEEFSE